MGFQRARVRLGHWSDKREDGSCRIFIRRVQLPHLEVKAKKWPKIYTIQHNPYIMAEKEQSYRPVSTNSDREDTEDGVFDRQEYYTSKKRSRTHRIASFLLRLVALVLAAAFVFKFWDIFSRMQRSLDHIETEMMDHPAPPGGSNHPNMAPSQPQSQPQPQPHPPPHPSKKCVNPQRRPAWHELSIPQRLEYISAVNCLATKESYINPNSTLYDDYTWMHIMDGDLGASISSPDNLVAC